ncbi:MAG: Glutamyl-tRNA(Gln) amidotransferase subunit A, partial [Microgenomates group bacterium GW2011_GWD1_33_9]
ELNAFITVTEELALEEARKADEMIAKGEQKMLTGIPYSVKDAICTKDVRSTASAKILDNYVPPFDATVIKNIREQGAVLVGKTNCDAFGHGASNEHSMYGPVKNPHDTRKVAGGSSGGAAASVADHQCLFAIAEDTGGSIRNPSSWCGITGLKVTYGRVSRYGAIAYASSFDTVGPMAKTAEDCAYILENIAGYDPYDGNTSNIEVPKYSEIINNKLDYTIGVPKEFFVKGLDKEVETSIQNAVKELKKLGCKIKEVSFPLFDFGVALYYIIAPSETSSNLGRYDGIRYGNGRDKFTEETKRRILIGTYSLSSGYYDEYYNQAQKARTVLIETYNNIFKSCDAIISPVSPTLPIKIGELINDPIKNYLADIYTVTQNPAGVPSLAIPTGFSKNNLPIGMQIVGPHFSEDKLLNIGHQFQLVTKYHEIKPNI